MQELDYRKLWYDTFSYVQDELTKYVNEDRSGMGLTKMTNHEGRIDMLIEIMDHMLLTACPGTEKDLID